MTVVQEVTEISSDDLNGMEVSEEQYLKDFIDYPDVSFEYVDGRLEKLDMSIHFVMAVGRLLYRILDLYFTHQKEYGKEIFVQQNYSTQAGKLKNNYRKPDIMVVSNDYDPKENKFLHGYIIVELISPDNKKRDTIEKKGEYQLKGIPYYFIIDETADLSLFYRLDSRGIYEEIPLINGDIIDLPEYPGLRFRISDLFNLNDFNELAFDPFYEKSLGFLAKKGRIEGIKIGEERGIKIGEERGIKIGRLEGEKKIIQKLISSGMPSEEISQLTGVSIDIINNWRR